MVSLGCPKNQVDADVFTRALLEDGWQTVPKAQQADVILVNTCGFIQSAKEEAIEAILDACAIKEVNPNVKVVVTGCLAERYKQEVASELPEVDAVIGIGSNSELPQLLKQISKLENGADALCSFAPKQALALGGARVISTPSHYAWLKIGEGCSNACSYCAIPMIRGPQRSRPMEDIVQEAVWLGEQGVKEIVLVAQDVTAYGADDKNSDVNISALLRRLDELGVAPWIRILYAYPEKITDELLCTIRDSKSILPYFDLPFQHCNQEILNSMGRGRYEGTPEDVIAKIRSVLPNATLRTSLIAGYPGESEQQFEQLCRFVRSAKFDRLGCFAFSPEEGTRAAAMQGHLPDEVRNKRAQQIMQIQYDVVLEKGEQMVGKNCTVLCDEKDEDENVWLCRSAADAPEIDGNILLPGHLPLVAGMFYEVSITEADGYDLIARINEE